MKPRSLLFACLLESLLTGLSVSAGATNSYLEPIMKRNVFSLGQPLIAQPTKQTPPAVILHGIVRFPGGTHALLRQPRGANPKGESSLWLREGVPAMENVHVLQIDVSAATVKVDNQGQIQTLKLEGN